MTPVNLITIHHEGAGNPVDWARGGDGGYSIWIGDVNGDHVYDVLRNPWISYATLGFNHQSLDICLSGDRDVVPVTDADIATIAAAVNQARALGWVIDAPLVRAHRNSPGSSTVCPGTNTMNRWNDVVTACTKPVGPPIEIPRDSPAGMSMIKVGRNDLNGIYHGKQVSGGAPVYGYTSVGKVYKQGPLAKAAGHDVFVRVVDRAHIVG